MKTLKAVLSAILFLPMASAVFAADVEISGEVTPSPPTSPVWSTGMLTLEVAFSNNSAGALTITNSGTVFNTEAIIGSGTNSQGTVNVSGNGVWNADSVLLGLSGTGTLNISGNGSANHETVILGGTSLASGSVNVSGSGVWNAEGVMMGYGGMGTLDISGNGSLNNSSMYVGYSSAASVQIRDSGSMGSGQMFIGWGAGGSVALSDQGVLRASTLTIGTGTLSIDDTASVYSTTFYMAGGLLGPPGNANATIEVNGGSLRADNFYLGGNGVIDGSGPSTDNAGTLKITGGSVSIGNFVPATIGSGTSKIHFEVSGGSLSFDGDLNLGTGQLPGEKIAIRTLELTGSGTVSSNNASVSASPGLSTEMTISGGTWIASGTMGFGTIIPSHLGFFFPVGGETTVEISGSAALFSGGGLIGGSETLVRMTGGSWTMTDKLQSTGGTLMLNGGTISSVGAEIRAAGVDTGTLEVNGGSWLNSSTLVAGGTAGAGTFKIKGGSVSNTDALIQSGAVVQISGGTWTNSGSLSMGSPMPEGYPNDSTLQIRGGVVTNGNATIGDTLGVAYASASGGNWTTTGTLTVADRGGYGELEISGSAQVTATAGVVVSGSNPVTEIMGNPVDPIYVTSTGVLNLNGGQLSTLSITRLGDDATVNFNGTVVQARQTNNQFVTGFATGDLNIMAGGAIFDSNGFVISIQSVLTGTGGLVKMGEGLLSLIGNNAYTGGTIIQSGTLQLGSLSALGSTTSRLAINGGTLDINGLNVTVGTLSGHAGGIIRTGIAGAYNLTINQVASGTFGGSIQNGAGQIAVTKTGTGTLRVTGSSSYTGATQLTEGATEISGAGALGSGNVTIAAGTLAQPGATLSFVDTASAGNRTYLNTGATENNAFGGSTVFYDTSSGGSARLVANAGTNGGRGGIISFTGSSSGGTSQVELYGNGRLTIAAHSAGTVTIGSLLGDGYVTLGANNLAVGANNLSTTFTGSIFDTGSITKVGTGTLTIMGMNAYTGGTRVDKGVLRVSGIGTLGSGTTTVASGTSPYTLESVLAFTDTASAGSGAYAIEGATFPGAYGGLMGFYDNTTAGSAWIVALGGGNAGSGGLIGFTDNSNGGTSQIEVQGNGRLTIATHAAGTVSIGSLSGDGLVTLGANTLTIGTNNLSTTFAGSISDTGAITKVGSGTLTVTGSNSYSGGTRLNRGAIKVSGLGTLGSGTTTIAAATSSQFEATLFFRDSANAGSGAYVNDGGTVVGAFGGLTGFYDNASAGSSKLVALGGSNGGGGGVIGFTGNSSGGNSQVEVHGNGRLTIATHNAGSVGIGSLSGDGGVTLGANNLSIGTNDLSTTFSGSISDAGSITKVGTGTLALTGRSTYSGGTEILAGTLILGDVGAGASALGTGDVLVGEHGRLGGIGTVLGDTTVEGILSPGNSPGTITFAADLSFTSMAVVQMELTALSTDFITVGGLLTYDGTLRITLADGFVPAEDAEFHLFDAGSVAIGSQFAAITFNTAGYSGVMNYETGTLTVIAVPEPSALALAAAGVLILAALRRRK